MKKFRFIPRFAWLSCLIFSSVSCSQEERTNKANSTYPVEKTDSEWKKILSEEQYKILRLKGTEASFTGALLNNKEKGIYTCAACSNPLFSSSMKFDSGTGWPSFDQELPGGKVEKHEDHSYGMTRTEILCANCGGHLGHLFEDGPTKTGLRYCVNSLSLGFIREEKKQNVKASLDTVTLGGGCYWCVEAVYELLDGVKSVKSGYSGGKTKNPSYEQVCSGKTGHAEVIQLVYDPAKVSFEDILKVFFTVHDPTSLNRQGADVGTQYRSVIFYHTPEQKHTAEAVISELNRKEVYPNPVVTELSPFRTFYLAEAYHQDYYFQNKEQGYCQAVIQPKIEKFEEVFKDKLKKK